jgi:very-short-patch-repair endonuclease
MGPTADGDKSDPDEGKPNLPESYKDTIKGWQEHLLQFDRRNRLLFFKTESRSPVLIEGESADSIMAKLDTGGLTFDYAEPRAESTRNRTAFVAVGEDDHEEPEKQLRVVEGDLRSDCPTPELQRRLNILRRRQDEWLAEQSLPVLFLAVGLLNWQDERGDPAIAPLLLLNVRLTRSGPRTPFELEGNDDFPVPNDTLLVKLQHAGLELPAFASSPDEGAQGTLADYFHSVQEWCSTRDGWSVDDVVYLGSFAYSKLAMYRDLGTIREFGTDNKVVGALSGLTKLDRETVQEQNESDLVFPEHLEDGALDGLIGLDEQYTVLPADASQLQAIALAAHGTNLVVHGPPGTGKSQTIANIISSLIARGQTVLFVCEKAAALDVVKRRLDEQGLGDFLLDLHSDRGKKKNIYLQIRESMGSERAVKKPPDNVSGLSRLREDLNHYVRELHATRQPLGWSIYKAQGHYAGLKETVDLRIEINNITQIDGAWLARLRGLLAPIAERPREFKEHHASHWAPLRADNISLGLEDDLRESAANLHATTESLRADVERLGEELGVEFTPSAVEARNAEQVHSVLVQLNECPQPPANWLDLETARSLGEVIARQRQDQQDLREARSEVEKAFTSSLRQTFSDALAEIDPIHGVASELEETFGKSWSRTIVSQAGEMPDLVERLLTQSRDLEAAALSAADALDLQPPVSIPGMRSLLETARAIISVNPVPTEWAVRGGIERARDAAALAAHLASGLLAAEQQLFDDYDRAIVDVLDHQWLVRYRTDHQSAFKRLFSGGFRRDQRLLRGFRKDASAPSLEAALEAVELTLRVQSLTANWESAQADFAMVLGRGFTGRSTSWEDVERAIATVETTNRYWPTSSPKYQANLSQEDRRPELGRVADALEREIESYQTDIASLCDSDIVAELQAGRKLIGPLRTMLQGLVPVVDAAATGIDNVLAVLRNRPASVAEVRDALAWGSRVEELEVAAEANAKQLQDSFGQWFAGENTDWDAIGTHREWMLQFGEVLGITRFEGRLADHLMRPRKSTEYTAWANGLAGKIERFEEAADKLDSLLDIEEGPWESWNQATFVDIEIWAQILEDDAAGASGWIQYRNAVRDLDAFLGVSCTTACRELTEDASTVPDIVERRVFGAWLDEMHSLVEPLRKFSTVDHERARTQFTTGDKAFPVSARDRVRAAVYGRYPAKAGGPPNYEQQRLNHELSKASRQRSARWLFGNVPHQIQRLKPCFLMSPLAVSQLLPLGQDRSNTLMFDTVIFDEASQVFPEDAVPALLHADQCILAGDENQLPPSKFWMASLSDDESPLDSEDDELESDALEGRESILAAAGAFQGVLFRDADLKVHYRSRHQDLIRFSNRYFYEDKLLVFPSPGKGSSDLGVFDHYLPEGTYQPKSTQPNIEEARYITDLVFQHMREHPDESLGVAALSRAQADLILSLVEQRRASEPYLEAHFTKESHEPFFVKNLESVQGDERDRIIIGIGYGPLKRGGSVPQRFGPIINEGGQRRLNVLVTRARKRMDVVRSMGGGNIKPGQLGARRLKAFLEYVADPEHSLDEGPTTALAHPTGEELNEFETAVMASLEARGHQVVGQVGSVGYRIDLAIVSDDGSRYDLGIECDGATYHSAPAARDRDWLRQNVLEDLGWSIHRVWSTSWIRNPRAELAAIESALAEARQRGPSSGGGSIPVSDDSPPSHDLSSESQDPDRFAAPRTQETQVNGNISPTPDAAEPPMPEEQPSMADLRLSPYKRTNLSGYPSVGELRFETPEHIANMVRAVVAKEGQVHLDVILDRIRDRFGLSRLRGGPRERVEWGVDHALQKKMIQTIGDFFYSNDAQLNQAARTPVDEDITHIPPSELHQIVVRVVCHYGGPREETITQVGRNLGYRRTGSRLQGTIGQAIDWLLEHGRLEESLGMIRAPSEACKEHNS